MMLFILICLISFLYFLYIYLIDPMLYWKRRNVFHVLPLKRLLTVFCDEKSFLEHVRKAYENHPTRRYYGSYQFLSPSLFVRDLDLIKQITVKDFDSFTDHQDLLGGRHDPLFSNNLFIMKGKKWRDLRSILSPAFTSSKMKSMFLFISEAAHNFTEHFVKLDKDIVELEMKMTYSKYTNDVIASSAFGVKCDSMEDPENEFFAMGSNLTSATPLRVFFAILMAFFPRVFGFFRVPLFPPKVSNFFRRLVKDTIALREQQNIVRPDMIHLLMEARKGKLKHEIVDKVKNTDTGFATVEELVTSSVEKNELELTDDVITSQALIFFFAGFDTTSTLLGLLSYELAKNPEIQKRLQEEIDAIIFDQSKASYDDVLKMKYLDQVVCEALRMWTPGFILNRVCTKDYYIPPKYDNESPLTLSKGCSVLIPVCAIHRDPNYWPNPDVFDPDRFSDLNKPNIVQRSYIPFGEGPRNCIGSRFALLETKALLVSFLSKFDFVVTNKTQIPLKLAKSFTLTFKDGIWLGIQRRFKT